MNKEYTLFDFQGIIAELKEKHNENAKFDRLLEGFNEDSVVEDMPFYEEYLSKFDVEQAFDGYQLVAEAEDLASRDDLYLLFRLIVASLSSSYDILYDKPSNSIDFSVTVTSGEQTITKRVAELWSFQIVRMFEIYLDELVEFSIGDFNPAEIEGLDTERKMRLMVFEKKVRQIRNLQDSDEVLSDLDDLLNS